MPMAVPSSVRVGSADVPLYTYTQLSNLSRVNLKQRMLNLRDSIGPQLPPLPAGTGIMQWIIDAQVLVAQGAGLALEAVDFGAPLPPPPKAKLLDKELGRLWEAGVKPPLTADVLARDESVRSLRSCGPGLSEANPNVPAWANPVSASRDEFQHDPSFLQASTDANTASALAKSKHRGSLGSFLFGDDSAEEPKVPSGYKFEPPFQVAPAGYVVAEGATTAAHYQAYPAQRPASGAEAARARNKGSYTFG